MRIVRLTDEHRQPIQVWRNKQGWWWSFRDWPEGEEQDANGPAKTEATAIADAQDYCDQGAP